MTSTPSCSAQAQASRAGTSSLFQLWNMALGVSAALQGLGLFGHLLGLRGLEGLSPWLALTATGDLKHLRLLAHLVTFWFIHVVFFSLGVALALPSKQPSPNSGAQRLLLFVWASYLIGLLGFFGLRVVDPELPQLLIALEGEVLVIIILLAAAYAVACAVALAAGAKELFTLLHQVPSKGKSVRSMLCTGAVTLFVSLGMWLANGPFR